MVSQRWWDPLKYLTGAYYTTHFKGERWSTSRRRPGGEATMVDWERSDMAMLEEEGRALLSADVQEGRRVQPWQVF